MRSCKIKILFLIDELSVGGTERQLLWLAEALPVDRYQPIIGVLRETDFSQGLQIRTPIVNFKWSGLPIVKNLLLINKIRRFLVRERVNILQTQFIESEIYGSLAAVTAYPSPVVIATRRNLLHWIVDDPIRFRVARYLLKKSRMIVANSHSAKNQCLRLEGVPSEKVMVIANAINVEKFSGLTLAEARAHCGLASDTLLIGVVGNLRTIKGVDVFLQAASKIAAVVPDASFILVGTGPQEDELKMLAASFGIADKVLFWGASHDVPNMMAALDIAVQPSRSESFSNVLVEYMAAAKPIVATKVGDAEVILDGGRCGLLVEPNSPDAMAVAIIDLCRERENALLMAERARQRALENWTASKILEKYTDFYGALES